MYRAELSTFVLPPLFCFHVSWFCGLYLEGAVPRMLTLITGGARSGKSRFAQSLGREMARVVYLATALPSDPEMRIRITKHRDSRPAHWITVEEPVEVPEAAALHVKEADLLLIDCVTLWLSNLLYRWRDDEFSVIEQKTSAYVAQLIDVSKQGTIVAVTNEVGSAIVPESPVARSFRDLQGLVNQQIATASDFVYLVVAGIPVRIKPQPGAPQ